MVKCPKSTSVVKKYKYNKYTLNSIIAHLTFSWHLITFSLSCQVQNIKYAGGRFDTFWEPIKIISFLIIRWGYSIKICIRLETSIFMHKLIYIVHANALNIDSLQCIQLLKQTLKKERFRGDRYRPYHTRSMKRQLLFSNLNLYVYSHTQLCLKVFNFCSKTCCAVGLTFIFPYCF